MRSCKSGARSAKVCALLLERVLHRPLNLNGGVLAWIERIDPSQQRYSYPTNSAKPRPLWLPLMMTAPSQ